MQKEMQERMINDMIRQQYEDDKNLQGTFTYMEKVMSHAKVKISKKKIKVITFVKTNNERRINTRLEGIRL